MNMNLVKDKLGKVRTYIRETPVHDSEWIFKPFLFDQSVIDQDESLSAAVKENLKKKMEYEFSMIAASCDLEQLYEDKKAYIQYENDHSRNYTTKKMRYGVFEDVLLPEDFDAEGMGSKFAHRFAKNMINGSLLRWSAWYYQKGRGKYMRFWFSDREQYSKPLEFKQVYQKTQFINKVTGCFCSKHDENAELLYTKGQEIPDAEPIFSAFNPTKVRYFNFSHDKEKFGLKEYRERLIECFTSALKMFNVNVIEGFLFKRRKQKRIYSRWIKRCVTAENRCQRQIEDELNHWYQKDLDKSPLTMKAQRDFEEFGYPNDVEFKNMKAMSPLRKELTDLYVTLSNVFKNHKFTYNDEEISLYGCRCDLAEERFETLKTSFKERLSLILAKYEYIKENHENVALEGC